MPLDPLSEYRKLCIMCYIRNRYENRSDFLPGGAESTLTPTVNRNGSRGIESPGAGSGSLPESSEDVEVAKGFARRFPQTYRVDKFCYFAYTLAVVFEAFGPGGEREVFRPRNEETRNGACEERPKWGASPAKPCEPLRSNVDAVHSLG